MDVGRDADCAVAAGAGTVAWIDWVRNVSPAEPSACSTGKERDAETGLDYFGARYMSAAQGRFTSVDPSLTVSLRDPQSWNRYSYVNNRPLAYIDPDGRWPRKIHDQIIAKAFPGLARGHQVRLKDASLWSDTRYTLRSEMHHTRNKGESGPAAKQRYNQFINRQVQKARGMQGPTWPTGEMNDLTQLNPEALWEFGLAMHAIQDSVAPPHVDENGDPEEYVFDLGPMIDHKNKEATITPQQMDAAVELSRWLFRMTFGQRAHDQATRSPQRKKKKDYEVDMDFRPDVQQ